MPISAVLGPSPPLSFVLSSQPSMKWAHVAVAGPTMTKINGLGCSVRTQSRVGISGRGNASKDPTRF
ncbi:hypothetical protein NL676_010624 [Syzygium grande]|nr:hypothetical protein NL676_010624 [Syzygium grande]